METFNVLIFTSLILVTAFCSKIVHKQKDAVGNIVFMGQDYTQMLKGIAIIIIMLGHCSGLWVCGRLLTPFGGIGVSLFLIMSGYGLNESYLKRGLGGFWKKRFSKVYIPYIIAALILVLTGNISISGGVILCYKAPYWFVTYIIECYIIFWICSRFLSKYRMYIFFVLSFCALILMPELQAEQSLGFITGVWMSEHKDKLTTIADNKKVISKIVLAFALFGFFALALKQMPQIREYQGTPVYYIIQLLIKLPISMAIIFGCFHITALVKNPFILFAGMISYELYLVHFPFYGYVGQKLWPAIVLWVLSFIVSWFFYKINNSISKFIA